MDHGPAKPVRVECGCKCGLYGAPRARPWRNGCLCVKRCKCKRCEAGRYKRRASSRERAIAKDTGGKRVPLSGAGGFADVVGPVWIEETAGEAVVRGIRRWFESKTVERKTRAIRTNLTKPWALVLAWAPYQGGNISKQLVVMDYAGFVELVQMAGRDKAPSEESA